MCVIFVAARPLKTSCAQIGRSNTARCSQLLLWLLLLSLRRSDVHRL